MSIVLIIINLLLKSTKVVFKISSNIYIFEDYFEEAQH